MADIPPNIVGPILQSGSAQQNAARKLENERQQQANAAEATSKRTTQATEAIDETGNDTQVHGDTEGLGGEGRSAGEQAEQADETDQAKGEEGISRDADGNLHIDLEA